jgi:uncharacterized membrane protein YdjX (TVP38/TMEM64 family)
MAYFLAALRQRLQRKVMAVAPIVVGALLLVGVLSIVVSGVEPYLPATYRHLLEQARQGDWTASRASLLALLDTYDDARDTIFVLIQVLQVLVAPIPSPLLGLLGGWIFGFWHGLMLNMIGLTIGSAIAMGSTRIVGEALVRRFVPTALLSRFDQLTSASDLWSFFLIFLLPVFPDDAICFMAGMTRLPLHQLVLVSVVGRLPGTAVLTFVGAGVDQSPTQAYLVLGVGMVLAFVLWLFSEECESFLARVSGPQHQAKGAD